MNQRDSNVPTSDEQKLEQNIIKAGAAVAPRITPDHIDSQIVGEAFHVFSGSQLTVCVLTLKNGYTVSGESACASPENFNEQIGQQIAKRNARDKIWSLEGYLLKQKLYENAQGDFISRLQREFDELNDRTKKLFAFFGTPIFKGLPECDQVDLEDQYLAMQSYSEILTRRLARLGK